MSNRHDPAELLEERAELNVVAVEPLDHYPYQPLRSKTAGLRLLTILAGTPEEPIQCKLWHASFFFGRARYETISYVWGDATIRGSITVNNITIWVPASSETALRTVRLADKARTVWIDAVCIDQHNVTERAQQVAIMRDIYARSQGNLIQLGECSTAEAAAKSVRNMLQELRDRSSDFQALLEIQKFGGRTILPKLEPLAEIDEQSLIDLFDNPWFTRIWVVQEAFSASSNTCYYGSTRFALVDVLRVCVWIRHNDYFYKDSVARRQAIVDCSYLWRWLDKQHGPMRDHGFSIAQALNYGRDLRCSVPGDKVFAVLGILDCTSKGQAVPSLLLPNYSKPVHEVFRDAVRLAMNERPFNISEILREIHHAPGHVLAIEDLPSWVPRRYFYGSEVGPQDVQCQITTGEPPFTGQVLPSVSVSRTYASFGFTSGKLDANVVQLTGLTLDNVTRQSRGIMSEWDTTRAGMQIWIIETLTLSQYGRLRSQEGDIFSIGKALVGGLDYHDHPLKDTSYGFEEFIREIFQNQEHPHSLAKISSVPEITPGELKAAYFNRCFKERCTYRRFFVTTKGAHGIGPPAMRPGDVVAIFHGVDLPYLLRKVGDYHLVVGHCYLEGAQEAYDRHRAEGSEDVVFNLR